MTKKLAIVISGAVSLGSYEAGVMYEVIEAIRIHNANIPDNQPADRIEIDVITGASAGGMTAAILAQNLLFDDGSLKEPYTNKLYKAWVEEVDISELLEVDSENQKYSIFNKDCIDRIGKKLVMDDATLKAKATSLCKHPSVASRLRIGIAMSNLTGYSQTIKTQSGVFGYTCFKDQMMCEVSRELDEVSWTLKELDRIDNAWQAAKDISWEQLRTAGISSGSFPLAFPMQDISRSGSNRDGDFLYSDGGIFENEPLGLAQELIGKEDRDSRFFLLVKPGPKNVQGKGIATDLLGTLIALSGAIIGQAQSQGTKLKEMNTGSSSNLFTITSGDSVLVGDVLSAFSGFLEEKFRAYDYNIGRVAAQDSLKTAAGSTRKLISYDQSKMPPLGWVVGKDHPESLRRNTIWSKPGEPQIQSWDEAKKLMKSIADSQKPDHTQIDDLRLLMQEVDPLKREKIATQLRERLINFIKYINQEYLTDLDETLGMKIEHESKYPASINDKVVSRALSTLREKVGEPLLTKIADLFFDAWLENNIVNPKSK